MDHNADAETLSYYVPEESPMLADMRESAEADQAQFDDMQARNLMDAVTTSERMAEGGVPSEKRPV